MATRTFPLPEFHHQFVGALRSGDSEAFYYFQISYMIPLLFIILSATDSFPESLQLMMKTFEMAEQQIMDYTDDEANCFFMWLFHLLVEYLSKTPGNESLHQYLTDLLKKTRPPY